MEIIREFEEIPRHSRPQDRDRDGRGLRFMTRGHCTHGVPKTILMRDAFGRPSLYTPRDFDNLPPEQRPRDPQRDGSELHFATLQHGGAVDDHMPQAIRVTDQEGRSCIYSVVEIDGRPVLPLGWRFASRAPPTALRGEG